MLIFFFFFSNLLYYIWLKLFMLNSDCHVWKVAAINSVLYLILFFSSSSLSLSSLLLPSPPIPPQVAKGNFHLHRMSRLLKGEQQIWPAGSIKMITPPSSGQIQLNRRCTLMTRKVNFLNSLFYSILSKK